MLEAPEALQAAQMAINALQVAWLGRLAKKRIIRPGDSIIEFGPQDLICSRAAVEVQARLKPTWSRIDEIFDGDKPRTVRPQAFYELFGMSKYKSVDLDDPRADWHRDLNRPFRLREQFDVATNFGTAEHVFNIAAVFCSIHDVLRPGGVALHVLPAFADIDHGFFNIHPTTYFDLAQANRYVIEELCYFDRWDIRNRVFEADLKSDYDFDSLPIRMEHLRDPANLKNMTAARFVENYQLPETLLHCSGFPGRCFDYCLVALRKTSDRPFHFPIQGTYGGNPVQEEAKSASVIQGSNFLDFARAFLSTPRRKILRAIRSRWLR